MQVSDIQHLYTPEWSKGLLTEMAEDRIYRIEHIGADHADLVDDQQFQFLQQVAFIGIEPDIFEQAVRVGVPRPFRIPSVLRGGDERAEGQLKKGMERGAARVDGRDPG